MVALLLIVPFQQNKSIAHAAIAMPTASQGHLRKYIIRVPSTGKKIVCNLTLSGYKTGLKGYETALYGYKYGCNLLVETRKKSRSKE